MAYVLHAYRVKLNDELLEPKFANREATQEFALSLLKDEGDTVSVWAEASSGTMRLLETSVLVNEDKLLVPQVVPGPRSRPSGLAERAAA
jgi:hypothetical protein